MSSLLPAYGFFFITHPFNLIRDYLLHPVTPSFENILFLWLPGGWPSPCFLNITAPFHFYWFLCPFSPSLSLSVGVYPVLHWFLPHSLLYSPEGGIVILPMTLRIASAVHASFFLLSLYHTFAEKTLIHPSKLSSKATSSGMPLLAPPSATRDSRVLPTLSSQNVMICVCVWFSHSEWVT